MSGHAVYFCGLEGRAVRRLAEGCIVTLESSAKVKGRGSKEETGAHAEKAKGRGSKVEALGPWRKRREKGSEEEASAS